MLLTILRSILQNIQNVKMVPVLIKNTDPPKKKLFVAQEHLHSAALKLTGALL